MATRGQSTFDGVHTTSGYHLPWALLLAAVSSLLRLFTVDKAIHLWAHLAVAFAITFATVRSFFTSPLFRVAAFVILACSFSLTEMTIAAPIVLALLRGASSEEPRRADPWLAFALPIVRIDLACVPLVIALSLCARERKRSVVLALATLAGICVQLVAMKLAFGHFVSVAAWLKASASLSQIPFNLRFNLAGESVFQPGLYLAHVLFAALAVTFRRDRTTWVLVLASSVFVVLHTVLSLVRGWYLVPSSIGLLFALERAMSTGDSPPARLRQLARAALALVAAVALAFVIRAVRVEVVYAEDQRVAATFVSEMGARVRPGARIYTWDNPGYLGFFSGFQVVDGDGLVNDFAYARRLLDGALAGYLDEERICHVVVDGEPTDDPALGVEGITLRREEVTMLFAVRKVRKNQASFVLYRLNAERCASYFLPLPLPRP